MNFQRAQAAARTSWNYLRETVGIPLMLVILAFGAFFIYTEVRDWQTTREIKRTNERLDAYDEQANKFIEAANGYMSKADANNAATVELFKVVKEMSGNLQKLADIDQAVTVKVKNSEETYEKTRTQKRDSAAGVRGNLSVREREDDVLAADRKLYPN